MLSSQIATLLLVATQTQLELEVVPKELWTETPGVVRVHGRAANRVTSVEIADQTGAIVGTRVVREIGGQRAADLGPLGEGRFVVRALDGLGPIAEAPSVSFDVLVDSLHGELQLPPVVTLLPGETTAVVTAEASALGEVPATLRFEWRNGPTREVVGERSNSSRFALTEGLHDIACTIKGGRYTAARLTKSVEVRPPPDPSDFRVRVDLDRRACPADGAFCEIELRASALNGSGRTAFEWYPNVSRATRVRSPSLRWAYGRSERITSRVVAVDLKTGLRAAQDVVVHRAPPVVAIVPTSSSSAVSSVDAVVAALRDYLPSLEFRSPAQIRATSQPNLAWCRGPVIPSSIFHQPGLTDVDVAVCMEASTSTAGSYTVRSRHSSGDRGARIHVKCPASRSYCPTSVARSVAAMLDHANLRHSSRGPSIFERSAALIIDAPEKTWVRLNDVDVGTTPLTLPVDANVESTISLRQPGCSRIERRTIKLRPGQQQEIRAEVCNPTAFLRVESSPQNAKVSIDGNAYQAKTPIGRVPLSAGSHRIAVYRDGYRTWAKTVNLRVGPNVLAVELSPETATLEVLNEGPIQYLFADGSAQGLIRRGGTRVIVLDEGPHKVCLFHTENIEEQSARCRSIRMPTEQRVVFEATRDTRRIDLLDTETEMGSVNEGPRIEMSAGVFADVLTQNSRFHPAGTTGFDARLALRGIETPGLPSTVGLGFDYADGRSSAHTPGEDVSTAFIRRSLRFDYLVEFPWSHLRISAGLSARLGRYGETLHVGSPHERSSERWSYGVGGVADLELFALHQDLICVRAEYRFLILLAPRELVQGFGRAHRVGLSFALRLPTI